MRLANDLSPHGSTFTEGAGIPGRWLGFPPGRGPGPIPRVPPRQAQVRTTPRGTFPGHGAIRAEAGAGRTNASPTLAPLSRQFRAVAKVNAYPGQRTDADPGEGTDV